MNTFSGLYFHFRFGASTGTDPKLLWHIFCVFTRVTFVWLSSAHRCNMSHLSRFTPLNLHSLLLWLPHIQQSNSQAGGGDFFHLQDRASMLVPHQLFCHYCRSFHAQHYLHRLFQCKVLLGKQRFLDKLTAELTHQPGSQCSREKGSKLEATGWLAKASQVVRNDFTWPLTPRSSRNETLQQWVHDQIVWGSQNV